MGRVKEAFTEIQIALEDRDFVSLKKILDGYNQEEKAYWLLGVVNTLADWQEKDQNRQEPIRLMAFEEWKAEFSPIIYEDSGAECFDHEEECECEFLYTFELAELGENEGFAEAIAENRVWSWLGDGSIVSGIHGKADLLVTAKAYTEKTEVR